MIIIRSDSTGAVKCPRCLRYWGIPSNYKGCCDRCIDALLSNDEYKREARKSQIMSVLMFHRDSMNLSLEEKERLANNQLESEGL